MDYSPELAYIAKLANRMRKLCRLILFPGFCRDRGQPGQGELDQMVLDGLGVFGGKTETGKQKVKNPAIKEEEHDTRPL